MEQMRRARSIEEVAAIKRALEEQSSGRKQELRAVEGIFWRGVVDWGNGEGRSEKKCEE